MKISIIVPFYNSVRYLEECIRSILNQTYQNWELILVDDGSTDGSRELATQFVSTDRRIRLFVQENQGVSAARNLGLRKSTGDFVSFVDSDDMLKLSTLQDCIDCIDSSVDIVRTAYVRKIHEFEEFVTLGFSGLFEKREIRNCILPEYIAPRSLTESSAFCSVWSCLFRKEIIDTLSFQNVEVMEDKLFFLEALLRARKIMFLDKCLYVYRIVPGSSMDRYHESYVNDMLYVCRHTEMILKENGLLGNNEERFKRFIFLCYSSVIYNELISSNKIKDSIASIRSFANVVRLNSIMSMALTKEVGQIDKWWCLVERGFFPLYFRLKKSYIKFINQIRKIR